MELLLSSKQSWFVQHDVEWWLAILMILTKNKRWPLAPIVRNKKDLYFSLMAGTVSSGGNGDQWGDPSWEYMFAFLNNGCGLSHYTCICKLQRV